MPMPPADLVDAYGRTDYRVRLAWDDYATIRVGKPLPEALQVLLPDVDAPWGFITAWNPYSEERPCAANRAAQRRLRDALRMQAPTSRISAGIGVGAVDADGKQWREPSLFVAGASFELLDALMLRFGQHAIVRGAGNSLAQLRCACSLEGTGSGPGDRGPSGRPGA